MTLLEKLGQLAQAAADYAKDGFANVSESAYYRRLGVCESCDRRLPGWICGECRCHLLIKAWGRAMKCPLGKWPEHATPAVSRTCRGCGAATNPPAAPAEHPEPHG